MARTLIVGEMFEGKVRKPTLCGVTFALKLKELKGAPFDILLPGKGSKEGAMEVAEFGAERVFYTEAKEYESYKAESYAPLVAGVVKK